MFTLSVAMIIKDEEKSLSRILESIKYFADEIIIVDTGSKDNSINIARKYTDKVFSHNWNQDFAEARNISFSHCTMDYIMWLDADDTISAENINRIIKLKLTQNPADTYMCKYSLSDNFNFYRERILRKSMKFKWSGAVHEVITPKGKIEYTDITIKHDKIKKSDPKRNLKIYNSLIRKGKIFTPREQYYYARELYYNGYFKSAIKAMKKYLKMKDTYSPNIYGAHIMLADIYTTYKDYNKSLNLLLKSLSIFTPTPEICCKIAENLENLQQSNLSIYWYETALICPKQNFGFVNTDYNAFIPYINLCRLYFHTNKDLSHKFHKLAKIEKPDHPSVIYNNKFFR